MVKGHSSVRECHPLPFQVPCRGHNRRRHCSCKNTVTSSYIITGKKEQKGEKHERDEVIFQSKCAPIMLGLETNNNRVTQMLGQVQAIQFNVLKSVNNDFAVSYICCSFRPLKSIPHPRAHTQTCARTHRLQKYSTVLFHYNIWGHES